MDRRQFVGAIGAASAGLLPSLTHGIAHAQDAYPSRPVTLINPFPPGGTADVVGRPLAAVLEPLMKQPVVIETKQGAAGQVGAQVAASAKPDGYTLLLHMVSLAGFPEVDRIYGRPVKFTRDDFIPIARFTAGPMVLLVNDQQPYKSVKELVDDVKTKPNELIFASSGLHGALHLPAALFLKAAGLQMKHLPTQGGGPSLIALIGNNAQMAVSSMASAASQVKAGKTRILATFSASRMASHPDVPTLKELGYDVEYYIWCGLFAPKGTPQPIIDRWRTETKAAVQAPIFVTAMKNISEEIAYLDQPEFKTFWDLDSKRVEEAVRIIGKV